MQNARDSGIRRSPTVWMTVILLVVYFVLAVVGGNFPFMNFDVLYPLAQVNSAVWNGGIWMLLTSMFLHANPAHLIGNVIFLLIFGTSLEEQVSTEKWLLTYFSGGFAGNIAFLFFGGDAVGVGASGAIWGLLAAAGGIRGLVGMVFYVGLNIFAGGGFLAHAGGLLAGLALRYFWFKKPSHE